MIFRSKHELTRWLVKQVHARDIPRKPPGKERRTSAIRDPDYMAWIRQQPSVISDRYGCEAAHTGSDGGMSMKASDDSAIPLTPGEHREYHQLGRAAFERLHALDCARIARRLWRAWRAGQGEKSA